MVSNLQKAFTFLNDLNQNNNRDWFQEHKKSYQEAHSEIISFADALLAEMNAFDQIETETGKKSLHRIYRDIRFSKDKTPYKNNFSGGFKRATAYKRGGYYFHLEPGNTFVAGGFWGPNAADLLHIRKQIQVEPEALNEIIESSEFKNNFGELLGEKLKTAPKGFDKEDPAIELLRYKQFLVKHDFDDQDVYKPDFPQLMAAQFKNMLPFFDYMSFILTTDMNGESLLG